MRSWLPLLHCKLKPASPPVIWDGGNAHSMKLRASTSPTHTSSTLMSATCSYICPQLTQWTPEVWRCQVLAGSGTRSPELFEVFLCSLELAVGQLKYSNSQNANTTWNKSNTDTNMRQAKQMTSQGKRAHAIHPIFLITKSALYTFHAVYLNQHFISFSMALLQKYIW